MLADGSGLLGNGLVAFVLGLLLYMGRVDRNWMRESLKELREALKELGEKVDRNAAEARAEREKGFAEARAEREKGFAEAKDERANLRSLLSQVAERTARIEGRQQGRAETLLESRLQELIEEHGVVSSAASD